MSFPLQNTVEKRKTWAYISNIRPIIHHTVNSKNIRGFIKIVYNDIHNQCFEVFVAVCVYIGDIKWCFSWAIVIKLMSIWIYWWKIWNKKNIQFGQKCVYHWSPCGRRFVCSWWPLVWFGYLHELCFYIWFIFRCVLSCLTDEGRGGQWWLGLSGRCLSCTRC